MSKTAQWVKFAYNGYVYEYDGDDENELDEILKVGDFWVLYVRGEDMGQFETVRKAKDYFEYLTGGSRASEKAEAL